MYIWYEKDTTIQKDTSILLYIARSYMKDHINVNAEACIASINSVKDALYVLNGKWKLPIIAALINGPKRFKELQRALDNITPKVLSKELRELELNELVERKVFSTVPVTIIYELTAYSDTVGPIIDSLRLWGMQHRERLVVNRRSELVEESMEQLHGATDTKTTGLHLEK